MLTTVGDHCLNPSSTTAEPRCNINRLSRGRQEQVRVRELIANQKSLMRMFHKSVRVGLDCFQGIHPQWDGRWHDIRYRLHKFV
jgi:hypothetical protein